ncbi:MAG: thiolase domain-containing protein [Rhodocyclaceae bacterium]|nr:MAG: thiolase domain-containing protein [Rhodocyclaceae bacterium]
MTVCIVGWAHGVFSRAPEEDLESLLCGVAADALADAGLEAAEMDAAYVGVFNAGFSRQDFPAPLLLHAAPGLRFKPVTRVENACATGSAAIHAGMDFIESGRGKLVLVAGAEKMTGVSTAEAGDNLLCASYRKEESDIAGGFAGVFARIAQQYFSAYGDKSEALARIAAKNHANALDNPYAQMRKDFGFEFCNTISDKNPYVAPPLRRTDCSLVSDGAAALVLADEETARAMKKAVALRAAVQATDFMPLSRRDLTRFEGPRVAWQQALAAAGVSLQDLSLVEVHDCFTIAELLAYEAMGLTPQGEGARAIDEGWVLKDGILPVNRSGGLKAKGHPIGATGVSMHVLAAMQLTGSAGGMQIADASLAGVFNMGGLAVANYVSILEPLRA